MNMSMPQTDEVCKKMRRLRSLVLNSSLDLGMSVAPKGDAHRALKSAHLHCKCSVPIVKLALIMLGAAAAMYVIASMFRRKCD